MQKYWIAIATYPEDGTANGIDHSESGDDLLNDELRMRGCGVRNISWDDSEVVWSDFALVVLRRTWDYHQRLHEFQAWIHKLETLGVVMVNTGDIVRWNMNKQYLLDLQIKGAPVIDTVLIRQDVDGVPLLAEIMQQKGWQDSSRLKWLPGFQSLWN